MLRKIVMVVMNYVNGKQLLHQYPRATPAKILEEVSEALKTLRRNDLVFDDQAEITEHPHYRPAPRFAREFQLVWRGRKRGVFSRHQKCSPYQTTERCCSQRLSAV